MEPLFYMTIFITDRGDGVYVIPMQVVGFGYIARFMGDDCGDTPSNGNMIFVGNVKPFADFLVKLADRDGDFSRIALGA